MEYLASVVNVGVVSVDFAVAREGVDDVGTNRRRVAGKTQLGLDVGCLSGHLK